ncbi:MAG: DUF4387 domain-containing protein [Proteobacteria bacterium]|nr:DUF4387 domain-containing protein [Pseudomonadota bacterium]MBI3497465.1 DUF4387 domain-containing protein [Pseudomonadota bacterium]
MTSNAARTTPLTSLAKAIRSKNAGVDKITFDVIFQEKKNYDLVRQSRVLSREAVCKLYGISDSRISDHVEFEPGLAIKFTIFRKVPSGSVGDADIFGSQQYGPLLGIEVPIS